MCGRFVSPEEAEIERAWHVGRGSGNPIAKGNPTIAEGNPRTIAAGNPSVSRFNTAPTTDIRILRLAGGALQIASARWGLVPAWWKDAAPPGFSFNARLEEAAEKPMWRYPLRHSRCLVPAEGWYEWQALERPDPRTGKPKVYKQPHFMRRRDARPFCFAGLMSVWSSPEFDAPRVSCAILTTAASGPVADVHDRMPVVIADAAHAEWLDPARTEPAKVADTIRRAALPAEFEHYPVSTAVNNSRSEGPQLIERLRDS